MHTMGVVTGCWEILRTCQVLSIAMLMISFTDIDVLNGNYSISILEMRKGMILRKTQFAPGLLAVRGPPGLQPPSCLMLKG